MRSYLLSLAALLIAGSAVAQAPAETFVFKKPDGFVSFNSVSSNSFYNAEYVPDGEQKGGVWKTRMLFQAIHDEKTRAPADYTATFSDSFAKGCSQGAVEVLPYKAGEGEKPATVMSCTHSGSYRVIKTMQGAETFYLVQYEYRFAPDEAQKAAARDYLDSIKLCTAVEGC